jgi:hypothetical protein
MCACQHPKVLPPSPAEAGRKVADTLPEVARQGFIEGFKNGAAMVQVAVRDGRKPYLIRARVKPTAPRPQGPGLVGVHGETLPLVPEVDWATGLQVRSPLGDLGSPFARGQEAGFQWALSGFTQELSSKGLVAPRGIPQIPADWLKWPDQEDQVSFAGGALSGKVTWFPGGLAWETEVGGFPPQRRWRPFPDRMKPIYVALKSDTLWLETREQGVVALDLDSGAILQKLPARAHDQPRGYDSYASYIAAERQKLTEPLQAARMEELRRRATQGDPQAMYDLARTLVVSDQEADGLCPRIVWILEAARRGQPQAMLEAAGLYFGGLGVPQDPVEARRWVDLAVAKGSEEARVARKIMFPPQD